MALFNVSLDDSSPLISYSGTWLDTPASVSLASNYSAASFHSSSVQGAAATLKFNGTGVWFYGAHRTGYGDYSLAVDGQSVADGSAASSDTLFNQLLGGSSNLTMGEHVAVLTNTGGGPIDLDSLIFENQVGTSGQEVSMTTLDDSDTKISYLPIASDWATSNNSLFANGSAHYTQTADAKVSLSFSGDAIAVYGGVSFDHGNYTVSLDGEEWDLNGANGVARMYHPQSLLYFAGGLNPGAHNLTITAHDNFFDMDSVVIYSANGDQTNPESPIVSADVPAGTDASGGQLPGNNEADHNDGNGEINNANSAPAVATKQSISKSVLIGIIAACVIGFLSLLAIIVFVVTQIRRRRHEKASGQELESPVLPMQNPDLEAGGGDFSNEKSASKLSRSNSRFTMMSRWSQASFISGKPRDHEPAPPVPPVPFVPSIAPQMNMPVPPSQRAPSTWNASGRSSPAPSMPEDDGRSEVVDDYYYRNSTASVAPLRPTRPPGLDLRDLGPAFDHVPL